MNVFFFAVCRLLRISRPENGQEGWRYEMNETVVAESVRG